MLVKGPKKKFYLPSVAPFYKAAAGGSVTLDVVGTELRTASSVTSASYTGITVGASANCLVCVVKWDNKLVSARTAVWDSVGANQSMTELVTQQNNANALVSIWGLRAPATGNKTLTLGWTTGAQAMVACLSFIGVNQASDGAAFPHTAAGNTTGTTSPSLALTSATGHYGVSIIAQNGTNLSLPTPGTAIFTDNGGGGGNGAAQYAVGAATITFGWTDDNGADNYAMAAVDVSP